MTDFVTNQAALDFYHEPAAKINDSLYKARQRADDWALRDGKVYAVVDMGNKNYQIWPKSQVGKEYKIVHETGGQAS